MKELMEENKRVHYQYKKTILSNKGSTDPCQIVFAWQSPMESKYSVAFRKHFAHFDDINLVMKRLAESGQLRKIVKKYFNFPECMHQKPFSRVGYEKLLSIFLLLASMMALSVMLMFIECMLQK